MTPTLIARRVKRLGQAMRAEVERQDREGWPVTAAGRKPDRASDPLVRPAGAPAEGGPQDAREA